MGCKERGRQVDGPLDHSAGKGWVKDHAYGKGWVKTDTGWKWRGAQYYDAKWVKKAITKNESGRTGAPGGRKGELRDRGLSKCLCLGVVSSVMSTSSE